MPDFFLRWTVRLAFACYVAALAAWLLKNDKDHRPKVTRILWTVACAFFLAHVWAAFQFVHHWSHADAWRETARQTRLMTGSTSGAGLWLNYIFAAAWLLDACRQWIGRTSRFLWIEVSVQLFFAFMWFNATIVFGHGFARWMGVAGGVVLLGAYAMRRSRHVSSLVHPPPGRGLR